MDIGPLEESWVPYVIAIFGVIASAINVLARRKQESNEAVSRTAENIASSYTMLIEDLKHEVANLKERVEQLEEEKVKLQKENKELKKRIEELERINGKDS